SMVDLHLFAGLMDAAGPGCRIILLGDMHQLPSVEAGAVLGDHTAPFLGRAGFPTLTKDTAAWISDVLSGVESDTGGGVENPAIALPPAEDGRSEALADHVVILTHSYRSSPGIRELCDYVNRGRAREALALIAGGRYAKSVQMTTGDTPRHVRQWLQAHYCGEALRRLQALNNLQTEAVGAPWHDDFESVKVRLDAAFKIVTGSRILVLAHEGEAGRLAINRQASALLRPVLDKNQRGRFFHGQLVILERNHHDLDLYNGDLGIVVRDANAGQKVIFRRGADEYRVAPLERLGGLEGAFAMTVHKSQGSEFDEVLFVLPEHESPLLSRQIVYTGITRARRLVRIMASPAILKKAIDNQEERPGGVTLECRDRPA
ncbi:MAG: ATP-binding domain-containing protein, partial [Chitinivibrionales bacterium]|nr:ATP-binding domain-containing protein [Chitinivibrionales bacterium]